MLIGILCTYFITLKRFWFKNLGVLLKCNVIPLSICRMNYNCKTCSKQFTQLRSLTCHEKSAHGEKMFVCEHCDKSFTWRDTLQRHQKQHTRMITHTCDNCKKEFYHCNKFVEHLVHCQENSLKRKLNEDGSSPTSKKMRSEIQVGEGEPYDGNEEDKSLETLVVQLERNDTEESRTETTKGSKARYVEFSTW